MSDEAATQIPEAKKPTSKGKKIFIWLVVGFICLAMLKVCSGGVEPDDKELSELSSAKAADISSGALAEIFNLGSNGTDIQRDKEEARIIGKVVDWTLPVYEVKKLREGKYRVQTQAEIGGLSGVGLARGYTAPAVGVVATVYTKTPQDIAFIEGVKTGNMIHLKGKITGVSMRHVLLDPALVIIPNTK